jgi:hypothetical protein
MQNNVLQVDRHSRRWCYVIDLFCNVAWHSARCNLLVKVTVAGLRSNLPDRPSVFNVAKTEQRFSDELLPL